MKTNRLKSIELMYELMKEGALSLRRKTSGYISLTDGENGSTFLLKRSEIQSVMPYEEVGFSVVSCKNGKEYKVVGEMEEVMKWL